MIKKASSSFIVCLLVLTGCSSDSLQEETKENEMHSSVDWADVIMWEGTTYFFDEEKTKEITEQHIDQELGEITFRVIRSEEEDNPKYQLKNGEATFVSEGSKIYSIIGIDSSEYIFSENKVYRAEE